MMDKGVFVKSTIEIMPGLNGGYVVRRSSGHGMLPDFVAFSSHQDMMGWLEEEYAAANIHPANVSTTPDRKEGQG